MNGGLSGSQLMGGDTDWLRAIGPYAGPLGSEQQANSSAFSFAQDTVLRRADYAALVEPRYQTFETTGTVGQQLLAKFNLTPTNLGPQQIEAPPFEFRSFFGDAYRNAAHEALSSENSLGVRAGYAASAMVLALPGLANDMARDVLNSPSRIYRGVGTMSVGIKAGDPYQFSSGLMNTSVGILGLAGGASVVRTAVLANVGVSNYAATQVAARSTYNNGAIDELAYRPLSESSNSFLSKEALANAGKARADLYQAWKADNAAVYGTLDAQVTAYKDLISGESPWPSGFTPLTDTLPIGTRIRMALSPGQPLTSPGAFATFDAIPNEAYVRNELAVKYGWKNEIGGVVEYEVTQPLPVRVGPVGPQIDIMTNKYLPGGGGQVNFNIPRGQSRMDYLNTIKFTPFN